ncbi:MAG: hypothetical protein K0R15_1619 [Clostridiales bacterium]|jgi:hypothetical protein|nr:hypothetical protein [Clostridiales bacterium]
MIIAAYAGVGKTTFASMYPDKVIDLECMPFKYYLEDDHYVGEAGKANPNNEIQLDWPYNYIASIKEILSEDKIILIPSDRFVLQLLREENIDYVLAYPQRNAKEEYRRRYIDRGNTEDFLLVFSDRWDIFLTMLEKDTYGKHIVLASNQFLSDVIEID